MNGHNVRSGLTFSFTVRTKNNCERSDCERSELLICKVHQFGLGCIEICAAR